MRESFKLLFWIVLALLTRLIPHPPNLTPYAGLILLVGCQLNRKNAVLITLVSLFLSDVLLAVFDHYPVFGYWSLFTYSGFIALAVASYYCLHQKRSSLRIALFTVSAAGSYWLWTNFGTWLISGMYPHTSMGFMTCFVEGLPFLQMSLLSDLIFVPLFFVLIILTERTWALKPH